MFVLYDVRLLTLGFGGWVWLLAFVAYDFASFLVHLISHRVRLLWCLHAAITMPESMPWVAAYAGGSGNDCTRSSPPNSTTSARLPMLRPLLRSSAR